MIDACKSILVRCERVRGPPPRCPLGTEQHNGTFVGFSRKAACTKATVRSAFGTKRNFGEPIAMSANNPKRKFAKTGAPSQRNDFNHFSGNRTPIGTSRTFTTGIRIDPSRNPKTASRKAVTSQETAADAPSPVTSDAMLVVSSYGQDRWSVLRLWTTGGLLGFIG